MNKTLIYTIAINICLASILLLFFLKIYTPLVIRLSLMGLGYFFAYKKAKLNENKETLTTLLSKGSAILILLALFLYYKFYIN